MLIHHPNITSRNSLLLCADIANPKSYSGTGTTIVDLTTSKNNMTTVGSVTYSNSFGGLIGINGTSAQYIVFGNAATTIFSGVSNAKSMEFWIRVRNLSARQGFVTTSAGILISVETTGAIRLGLTSSIQILVTASGLINPETWYHIVVTRTSGNIFSVYINGTLRGGPTSYIASLTVTNARVGGGIAVGGGAVYYNGDIALIRTYNIALTASQILQNYNATKGRFGL